MKLYFKPGACSFVPHFALEKINQPYEAEAVTQEYMKSPEYLELNPQGAVPLLVDGNLVLSQNLAILTYLDDLYPQAKLFGSDSAKGKAIAFRWLAFLNSDVHKAFVPLFHVPPYVQDESLKQAIQKTAKENILGMLAQANHCLSKQNYLGEDVSVADIYLFTILGWCKFIDLNFSSLTHLTEFAQRIAALDIVKRVQKAEGLI